MGVVYKAEDSKLERPVALKFLPSHLLGDQDVRKRFEREAKAAAALSHSNVCTVYEIDEADGHTFIAMELMEGVPLDEKIALGPLKLEEALEIARQVANGLEAAHKKGIVHRDIKPQNIMVGEDGHVTIMDFGLAQLTQASLLTRPDQTMGTTFYMSPEQTEGSGTDHRTDIWSLGVMLYEMVTGQRPFKGDYDQAVMYSILNEEPEPITGLRTGVPMELEVILTKCLAKQVENRHGSAAEVTRDLRVMADKLRTARVDARLHGAGPTDEASAAPPVRRDPPVRPLLSYVLTVVGCALAGALLTLAFTGFRPSGAGAVTRMHLNLPGLSPYPELRIVFAVSPDGRRLVFEANGMLYLRELDGLEVTPVAGTEGGYSPFISPDGQWLGFLTATQVRRLSLGGGTPETLANLANAGAGVWTPGGDIVIALRGPSGLKRISADGTVTDFTALAGNEVDHDSPTLLPDGDTVIFGILRGDMVGWDGADILAQSLSSGERKLLLAGVGSEPQFAPSGHLLYVRAGNLMAVPFDADLLETRGVPTRVLAGVVNGRDGFAQYKVASEGSLYYLAAAGGGRARGLVWVDRAGREEPVGFEAGARSLYYPRISPDGSRLAMSVEREDLNIDILVYDLVRGVLDRTLTRYQGHDWVPTWSADGSRVFHVSDEEGGNLVWKAADGSAEGVVAESWLAPQSASPDGARLVYIELSQSGGRDIGVIPIEPSGDPSIILGGASFHDAPVISPDGKFLAYTSTESGKSQVYVSPFPAVARNRWPVSRDGGAFPAWSRDGRELFYLFEGAMMSSRRTRDGPGWEEPSQLFEGDYLQSDVFGRPYDIGSDGRFLMMRRLSGSRPEEITVVQNWFEELGRLVPGNY